MKVLQSTIETVKSDFYEMDRQLRIPFTAREERYNEKIITANNQLIKFLLEADTIKQPIKINSNTGPLT